MKILYITLIALVSSLCHGQVYRCLNEKSEITFAATPCDSQSQPYQVKQGMALKLKTIDAPNGTNKTTKAATNTPPKNASCASFSATQLRNLRVKKQFQKGMPAAAIIKRFGKAQRVKHKPKQQQVWIYKSARVQRTFKFKNDCLSSWREKWQGKKSKLGKYQI